MSQSNFAIYDYIVRELAPTKHDSHEAPITIVCEPPGMLDGSPARGKIFQKSLKARTPLEKRDARRRRCSYLPRTNAP